MTPISLNDLQEFVVLVLGPLVLLSGAIIIAAIAMIAVVAYFDSVVNSD